MKLRTFYVYYVNCDCAAYWHAWTSPPTKTFRRCIGCRRSLADMQLDFKGKFKSTSAIEAVKAAKLSNWRIGGPHLGKWLDHEMMSVAGCIDSHGAITAEAFKDIGVHTPETSRGKRWRWLVHSQEFHHLAPRTIEESNKPSLLQLNDEETYAVCDWLVIHGYADNSIMPKEEDRP